MNYKYMIHGVPAMKSCTNNSMELAMETKVLQAPDLMVLITSLALEAAAPLISYIFSLWK